MSFRRSLPSLWRGQSLVIVLMTAYVVMLVRTAWLCDDAYISFRVVDNFIHGHGLRWNIVERVQVYTHPLWLFLVSVCYFFTREIYFTAIFLSMAVSLAALGVLSFGASKSRVGSALAVVLLLCSNAYVDYSTSGLENPLTYLLLAVFAALFLRQEPTPSHSLLLAFVASLGMVNRVDTALLFAPALAYTLFRVRNARTVLLMAAGFAPWLLWEAFSLLYYGFPFPNTYYVKLGAGVPVFTLLKPGLAYLWDSLRNDSVTLPACAAALTASLVLRQWRNVWLAAGMLLYLAYVISIGGDYMSGRFLAAPVFVAALVIAGLPPKGGWRIWGSAFACAVVLGYLLPHPTPFSRDNLTERAVSDAALVDFATRGVADARRYEYVRTGLLGACKGRPMPDCPDRERGLLMWARRDTPFMILMNAGMLPFFAGPSTYFLDVWGLGDAFRAHFPAASGRRWAAGHVFRSYPPGYVDTLRTGENKLKDEQLSSSYERIKLIIRGPLFSRERLRAIVLQNLGSRE